MGDADLTSNSFALNYDSGDFMDHFLDLMTQAQDPSSHALPDVVPFMRYGGLPADPSWSAAMPQNMWVRYKIGGTLQPAQQYWDAAYLYMQNLAAQLHNAGGMANWNAPYGDWYVCWTGKASE